MEIGHYIDFHYGSGATSEDFSTRLNTTGAYGNSVKALCIPAKNKKG